MRTLSDRELKKRFDSRPTKQMVDMKIAAAVTMLDKNVSLVMRLLNEDTNLKIDHFNKSLIAKVNRVSERVGEVGDNYIVLREEARHSRSRDVELNKSLTAKINSVNKHIHWVDKRLIGFIDVYNEKVDRDLNNLMNIHDRFLNQTTYNWLFFLSLIGLLICVILK